MKRSFLKKIIKISSCFSILTLLTVHYSFAGSFIEDSLPAQISELSETLQWISDNERFDYLEKSSLTKNINQLNNILNIIIDDNERLDYPEKIYLTEKMDQLNNILNFVIDNNERIYPNEMAFLDEEIDKLIRVLGVIIHDNERVEGK